MRSPASTSSSPMYTATSAASSWRRFAASGSRSHREMIQGNRADRQAGAIVGLHYHLHQADYWYVPFGRARVVLHDLRVGSTTEGKTMSFDLGSRADGTHDHTGVFIPPGVAHGFGSLTDMTITYLVDGYYNEADELGVAMGRPRHRR